MTRLTRVTNDSLLTAVDELTDMDDDLAVVIDKFGPPPLWARKPGYATLVHIILEQQVSLASAKAIFDRLKTATNGITPEAVTKLKVDGLRDLGFTGQKAQYCHGLAELIVSKQLDLKKLARCDEHTARGNLLDVRGIGPWTADIYLLMVLRHADIWPDGDFALAESARKIKRLRKRPDVKKLRKIADAWSPWRSVAARILWHAYLSERR
ncbi:MAG: DNA-3-methyladenine glycosylase 2 family protein [Gammaproteobacteria bacterium]|nr:DNA-3-methyladenine glycosylase 2 family protein [Gammaproteobacteria bacterium]